MIARSPERILEKHIRFFQFQHIYFRENCTLSITSPPYNREERGFVYQNDYFQQHLPIREQKKSRSQWRRSICALQCSSSLVKIRRRAANCYQIKNRYRSECGPSVFLGPVWIPDCTIAGDLLQLTQSLDCNLFGDKKEKRIIIKSERGVGSTKNSVAKMEKDGYLRCCASPDATQRTPLKIHGRIHPRNTCAGRGASSHQRLHSGGGFRQRTCSLRSVPIWKNVG